MLGCHENIRSVNAMMFWEQNEYKNPAGVSSGMGSTLKCWPDGGYLTLTTAQPSTILMLVTLASTLRRVPFIRNLPSTTRSGIVF